MSLKNLTTNWSTALWHILEPKNLLTSAVAGLRFMLDRLGSVDSDTGSHPIGVGNCYYPVTTKLTDIACVSGGLAGSGDIAVAGAGDKVYRVSEMPEGIVLFAKSASAIDDVMVRGVDFKETLPGVYIFKKSPVNCGIVSIDDGGSCSWICTIGIPTNTGLQDRLEAFSGSTNHRINKQISNVRIANDALNGQATVGNYLCAGADAMLDDKAVIMKLWQEGSDFYCIDDQYGVTKLSKAQYMSAEVGNKLSNLKVSDVALIRDGSSNKLHALPFAGGSDMVAFDVGDFNDKTAVKLLDRLTPRTNAAQNIQKLKLKNTVICNADELLIYYHSSDDIATTTMRDATVDGCIARAEALYGVIHATEKPSRGYWLSCEGKVFGKRPVSGDYIKGVTGVFHSRDNGGSDILIHEDINNEFIRPNSIILIEAQNSR